MAKTTLGFCRSLAERFRSRTQPARGNARVQIQAALVMMRMGGTPVLGVLLWSPGWPRRAKAAAPVFVYPETVRALSDLSQVNPRLSIQRQP